MENKKELKIIKITVIRKANYLDLQEKYENKIEHTCDLKLNQIFYSVDGKKPDGMCSEAWKSLEPFVVDLANGKNNFFDGWMQDPDTAMISCNDGFRPVSFLVEVVK